MWEKILSEKRCKSSYGIIRLVCRSFRVILHGRRNTCAHYVCRNIKLLEYSLEFLPPLPKKESFTSLIACHCGVDIAVFVNLVHHFPISALTMSFLAAKGDIDGIKYMRKHGLKWDSRSSSSAIKNKHNDIYFFLKVNGCPTSHISDFRAAVIGGNLIIAKHIYSEHKIIFSKVLLSTMGVYSNSVKMVEWLRSVDLLTSHSILMEFVFRRNITCRMLNWLQNNGYYSSEHNERYMLIAAKNGKLQNMKWLIKQGAKWDSRIIEAAQKRIKPHKHIIGYAIKNGCPLPSKQE